VSFPAGRDRKPYKNVVPTFADPHMYSVAPERGGVPADKANYPVFMSKLKAAFKPRGYELSFTAPSSYWYLQHFDLPALLQSADWVCKRS
jgi:hypothetical protein